MGECSQAPLSSDLLLVIHNLGKKHVYLTSSVEYIYIKQAALFYDLL